MRRFFLCLALVPLLLTPLVRAQTPEQVFLLAYVATGADGNEEIYTLNPLTGEKVNLTQAAGLDSRPAWSPDGTQIAFDSTRDGDQDIYLMNADGSQPRNLSNSPVSDDYYPLWSPDGTRLAFISDRTGDDEIYIMDSDGNNVRQVTAGLSPTCAGHVMAWSPDATRLIFDCSSGDGTSALYIINADGGGLFALKRDARGHRWIPRWLPDGGLAYIDENEQTIVYSNADGSAPRFLFDTSTTAFSAEGVGYRPVNARTWSPLPNGGAVLWLAATQNRPTPYTLNRATLDGKNVQVLAEIGAGEFSFRLLPTPDESAAIFIFTPEGQLTSDIQWVNLADGTLINVTQDALNEGFPVWRPIGAPAYQPLVRLDGVYTWRADGRQFAMNLSFDRLDSEVGGRIVWPDFQTTTRFSGAFADPSTERVKWEFLTPLNPDPNGAWLIFSETAFVQGAGVTLGTVFYVNLRGDGSMVGLQFLDAQAVSPIASFELALVE
jgi:dipeptidyl aminopeptidase/acylaminoacyl peptidase